MPHKLYSSFKKISRMTEIRFLEYGKFCGKDWNHKGIKEPYNRLYIVLDGQGFVRTQKEIITLNQGYAYLIPKNLDFDSSTIDGIDKLFIHFDFDSYFHIDLMNELDEILQCKVITNDFIQVAKALDVNDNGQYFNIHGQMVQLVYQLLAPIDLSVYEEAVSDMPEVLHELYGLLQVKLTARTRIGELANHLGISQSMLSKVFKEATGMTLKHYLKQQLMAKAQIALTSTNDSVKSIAYSLEYEDALYFSKVFHQWTGLSPSVYRTYNAVS